MKDPNAWVPTKFVMTERGLRASRDTREVSITSRLSADLMAPRYQRMLEGHARGRLLDLGAGQVPLYSVYRGLVDSVTCVDWAGSPHPSRHVDLFLDLNRRLPLPDGGYDTLLLTDVLEHISRPDRLWPEMARVLAPGGCLLLATPFMYWIHEAPNDYLRYTEYMLRGCCTSNGLEILELQATGGSPEVMVDLIGRHLAWSPLLSRVHFAVAQATLALPPVRRLSERTSRWFPLGYTLVARRADTSRANATHTDP
jgi:SAM-dependent methyltransferase